MEYLAIGLWGFVIGLFAGQRITRYFDRSNAKISKYIDAIERDFDPIECRENHLPGDCPLCGAN